MTIKHISITNCCIQQSWQLIKVLYRWDDHLYASLRAD